MRITSLGTNFNYTTEHNLDKQNINRRKENIMPKKSNPMELKRIRDFKVEAYEISLEEEFDLEKINKIKIEMESLDLTSELLADVLISSFKNNRG